MLINKILIVMLLVFAFNMQAKEKIKMIYIPLADHYAAILAYDKYKDKMKDADFSIQMMKSWNSLRGKFTARQADIAGIISPLALDMFDKKPHFRFVSLMHRDGNALAINDVMNSFIKVNPDRLQRKPSQIIANAMAKKDPKTGDRHICAVPHLLATHTAVLYKFLKDHGKTLALGKGDGDVMAKAVSPSVSPAFIENRSERGIASSFEQSLPWADVVDTNGYGKVAWYSKDVVKWPNGHVECILIAQDDTIKYKKEALKEVIYYIHKAGQDIENAMKNGGDELYNIAKIINRYIPKHNVEAIVQSLRADLKVINYHNLNVDKAGLEQIMNLAVEADMIKSINLDEFVNDEFSTTITNK